MTFIVMGKNAAADIACANQGDITVYQYGAVKCKKKKKNSVIYLTL